jgi:hypothetical protein
VVNHRPARWSASSSTATCSRGARLRLATYKPGHLGASAAIIEAACRKIYEANELADELTGKGPVFPLARNAEEPLLLKASRVSAVAGD